MGGTFKGRIAAICTAGLVLMLSTAAQSAPVNFLTDYTTGYRTGPATLTSGHATFSSHYGLMLSSNPVQDGGNGSICSAIGTDRCFGDMRIDFDAPVKNLSLHFGGYDQGDLYYIYLFNASNTILTSYGVTGNGSTLFTGPLEISYAKIVMGSDLSMDINDIGMYFHSLSYELVNPQISAVPLPAGLPLFASAIALLSVWRGARKRRA